MANSTIKNIIIVVLITLISPIVIAYLTAESPILFSEKPCDYNLKDTGKYFFTLENRAKENIGVATVCFKSDIIEFKNGNNFTHDICYPKIKVNPITSELKSQLRVDYSINLENLKNEQNITLEISSTCGQNIWSLLPKECDKLYSKCIYKKEGNS